MSQEVISIITENKSVHFPLEQREICKVHQNENRLWGPHQMSVFPGRSQMHLVSPLLGKIVLDNLMAQRYHLHSHGCALCYMYRRSVSKPQEDD